ncbi:hypothetical protein EVAR_92456_1 [Eumeta japonica]|uniref:Uncharacterized protein n=1 Tax=Eumeta variegata TaxID=151549 RepID=A0A4C1T602_EUMVA|nr:hypothetical protein EVAR_92456_1 [Eumeta japonica]
MSDFYGPKNSRSKIAVWLLCVAPVYWGFEDFIYCGRSAWDAVSALLPYECHKVCNHRDSSSMAFWRRGVICLKLLPRGYTAISSDFIPLFRVFHARCVFRTNWTPVCGRGMSFIYAEYSSGESVEP